MPYCCHFEAPERACGASPFKIAITKQDLRINCHQRATDRFIVLQSFRSLVLHYYARSSELLHSDSLSGSLSGSITFNAQLLFSNLTGKWNQHWNQPHCHLLAHLRIVMMISVDGRTLRLSFRIFPNLFLEINLHSWKYWFVDGSEFVEQISINRVYARQPSFSFDQGFPIDAVICVLESSWDSERCEAPWQFIVLCLRATLIDDIQASIPTDENRRRTFLEQFIEANLPSFECWNHRPRREKTGY
jgi:hypothetical protein